MMSYHTLMSKLPSVNEIVPKNQSVKAAIKWAKLIASSSPDAVQSNKRGIISTLLNGNMDDAVQVHVTSPETERVFNGENVKVGRDRRAHCIVC